MTYVFMNCILFKWKLSLFLDFLKYICILCVWGTKIIRLFKNLQNFKDIFQKKNLKILGGPGPLWSSSGFATGRSQKFVIGDEGLVLLTQFNTQLFYNHTNDTFQGLSLCSWRHTWLCYIVYEGAMEIVTFFNGQYGKRVREKE